MNNASPSGSHAADGRSHSPKVCHIVAMSENRVIGRDGSLPWRLPSEMRYFKETTMGHPVIMGRKTFAGLPKVLPGRLNIVVTRKCDWPHPTGVLVAGSPKAALNLAETEGPNDSDKVFIIGGGEIYRETIDLVDQIYLTTVHTTCSGDTFYPAFELDQFETLTERHVEGKPSYTVRVLNRLNYMD